MIIRNRKNNISFKSQLIAGIGFVILVLAFVVTPHLSWAQTTGYIFTEIHPSGWSWSRATDITDSGMVLGYGYRGGNQKGFLYSGGTYTELIPSISTPPPPSGIEWQVSEYDFFDINNSGAVVGTAMWSSPSPEDPMDYFNYSKGFLYSAGTYTELIPPGYSMSSVSRINDNGVIIGYAERTSSTGELVQSPFVYSGGTYTMLSPPPAPYSAFSPYDINNNGDVVGRGFILSGPSVEGEGLGIYNISTGTYTFTEPLPSTTSIAPYEINDNGVVVGTMYNPVNNPGATAGFLYSGGIYTELMLPGMDETNFYAINNSGTAVGGGSTWDEDMISYTTKGFLYSEGTYTELLPSGMTGSVVYDINNSGTIVGYAWASPEKGFMVSVAPEPISSILFMTGGALLAGRQYLKKRRRV